MTKTKNSREFKLPLKPFMRKISALTLAGLVVFAPVQASAQSAFDDPGSRNPQGNASGGLTAVNNNLDSGSVTLGSSSQVVLLFRNDGNKPVTMGAIDLYPSSNVSAQIAQNECAAAPLDSGAICAIAMSVKGLQPGRFRVELLIRHDGRSKLITSTVTGLVDSTDGSRTELINDIEAIPTELDFGSLSESRTQVQSIILRNVTSKTIKMDSIGIRANPQSGYTLEAECDELESGEACVATVTWAPVQRGPATGVLVVKHDGPAGVTGVAISGDYTPGSASQAEVFPEAIPGKGLLTASQTEIDFGTGIESSSAITASLVNVGDAPIRLNDIRLSNDKNGIEISRNGCTAGTVLKPVEACALTLTWEPVREGDVLDDIQIRHDGARGILVLPVRGSAAKAINKDSESIFLGDDGAAPYLADIPALTNDELGLSNGNVDVNEPSDVVSSETGEVLSNGESASSSNSGLKKRTTSSGTKKARDSKTPSIDVRGVLDGYRITSLGANRGIISGPGGSRVVFNREEAVIGGVLWDVSVRSSAVQFSAGEQKVLLLFDKALTSFNSGIDEDENNNTSNNDDDDE